MLGIDIIGKFNPWWTTGSVRKGLLEEYKRKLYFEAEKFIDKRQALLI